MAKTIMEMVAEIVTEFVANQSRWLNEDEVAAIIQRTYRELKQIEALEAGGASLEEIDKSLGIQPSAPEAEEPEQKIAVTEPKIDPKESIKDDKVICVECLKEFKTLTHTHLREHGLSPDEYKRKWGIPANQPLSARSVSEQRKEAARQRNVGEFLKQKRAAARGGELRSGELFQPVKEGAEQEEEG